jgi:hypothetical protein
MAEQPATIMVETARLEAVMRMLVDSGDMTPMAVRQIKVTLGLLPSAVEVGEGR